MPALSKDAVIRLRIEGEGKSLQSLKRIEAALDRIRGKSRFNVNATGRTPRGGGSGRGGPAGTSPGGGMMSTASPFNENISRLTMALAGFNAFDPSRIYRTTAATLQLAATVQTAEAAFATMSDTISQQEGKFQDWRTAVEQVRVATKGQISNLTIMQSLLRLQSTGLDVNAESFGELANNVLRMAAVFGQEGNDSIKRVTRGIVTLEKELLDNIGIFINLRQAMLKFARDNGRSVESITELEKQSIFLNAALSQSRRAVQAFGADQNQLALDMNRAQASWENLISAVTKGHPVLAAAAATAVQAGGTAASTVIGFGAEGAVSGAMSKAGVSGFSGLLSGGFLRALGPALLKLLLSALAAAGLAGLVSGGVAAAGAVWALGLGSLMAPDSSGAAGGAAAPRLTPPVPPASQQTVQFQTSVNVPLMDGAIDRASQRVAQMAATAMRSRVDDAERGIRTSFRTELDQLYGSVFTG